jgi:hypothetical protein
MKHVIRAVSSRFIQKGCGKLFAGFQITGLRKTIETDFIGE